MAITLHQETMERFQLEEVWGLWLTLHALETAIPQYGLHILGIPQTTELSQPLANWMKFQNINIQRVQVGILYINVSQVMKI